METTFDKWRAVVYALLVHLGVFGLLFLGLLWTQQARPVAIAGPVIEAELVGAPAAPRASPKVAPPPPEAKPAEPPPQSKPAPPVPEPPRSEQPPAPPQPVPPAPPPVRQPPPTVQKNDNRDQEKIAEIAQQKAEAAKRAEEEKIRQHQIELQQEAQRKEAEEKQRQQQIQQQLAAIREEREKNEKKINLEKQGLAQLDQLQKQQAAPPPKPVRPPPADVPDAEQAKTGMNGNDASLLAEYSAAIVKVVNDNWNRPSTTPSGVRCTIEITQIPGGTVIDANIGSPCNADMVTQNSIRQAVTKAQPLPYKGYESVFQRKITFIFKYDGN